MTDREKVVLGLRCAAGEPMDCAKCPYRHIDVYARCVQETAADAMDLLRGPGPARLLTHEDFHGPMADDGGALPAWKESRKPTHRSGWVSVVWGKALADKGTARYWTARPTEEQTRAEKWD